MGLLTTCLVSLAAVNIALGLIRLWRRSVEARMVRQVRALPVLDAYHAELLGAAAPLCARDFQPDRLTRNSCRAAAVALRLLREDGLLRGGDDSGDGDDGDGGGDNALEAGEGAAEPPHPVTAAAFHALRRYTSDEDGTRLSVDGSVPTFQAAVRAHLDELFALAPATRLHMSPFGHHAALWTYGIGAAAPAVHTFFLLRAVAPADPDVVGGSFVLASLVFVAALIVLTAQAGNTWHPLEDLEVPAAFRLPFPDQGHDQG
ncbi:hypothetical protein OG730_20265 [Streptomyces sp. NBC_01298]|uniref:hypothetical protein n=1 Tax=Streptomyces sp. NBC_01298 TaxID=2903817 RepID=UPI002E0E6591|nr:hypothetical protein OG730_20265 [Streptomyces sp. NBC_01298]